MEVTVPGILSTYTTRDGYRCSYRAYRAVNPRARLVCLHGIQSHGGWYEHSCQWLAAAGFDVTFLDRRGSGQNQNARGDTPSFRRLLDDIADFLHPLTQTPPRLPLVLMGISWGGKLAAAFACRHPGFVDALALLCPGFCPRLGLSRATRLAVLWARLTAPTRRFPVPLSDPEIFTASPRWQQFLRDDPLALHHATARFLVESVRLDGYLRWKAKRVGLPILMLLAEKDRIIDNERTRCFFHHFASTDKEIREYPGAHHTLEFESDPERHLLDLKTWLERQVSKEALDSGRPSPCRLP
jgi:alpha-beta hydrolase superfamily lysophospholipase